MVVEWKRCTVITPAVCLPGNLIVTPLSISPMALTCGGSEKRIAACTEWRLLVSLCSLSAQSRLTPTITCVGPRMEQTIHLRILYVVQSSARDGGSQQAEKISRHSTRPQFVRLVSQGSREEGRSE